MFDRLSRSWRLAKASASVLRQDKELLLFPLISLGALVLVLASFAVPVIGLGVLDGLSGHSDQRISIGMYVIAFLFYFSQYFVIFFFNAALVGAAMMRLDGGNPTFGDGLRIASSKIGVIAGYALIAATVGMILRGALTHSVFLIVVALVAAVLAVGVTGLVQSALTGIYAAALYRYATTGEGTQGFDAQAMQLAFTPKK